jgi:hypothetical protein
MAALVALGVNGTCLPASLAVPKVIGGIQIRPVIAKPAAIVPIEYATTLRDKVGRPIAGEFTYGQSKT